MHDKNAKPGQRFVRTFLLVVILVVVFAYGFQVTRINLEEPKKERRQEQLLNVIHSLARPDLTQYETERLEIEAGQPVTFDRVLLVNTDGKIAVGSPTVASATVVADVVEHIRGEKKIAFKMKRRKGYHKTIGSRAELTVVKIKEIKA